MDLKESGTTSASEQPDNLVEIVGNYRYAIVGENFLLKLAQKSCFFFSHPWRL